MVDHFFHLPITPSMCGLLLPNVNFVVIATVPTEDKREAAGGSPRCYLKKTPQCSPHFQYWQFSICQVHCLTVITPLHCYVNQFKMETFCYALLNVYLIMKFRGYSIVNCFLHLLSSSPLFFLSLIHI